MIEIKFVYLLESTGHQSSVYRGQILNKSIAYQTERKTES